jgi:aspartate/methionine/tyrosine aminotransferase
MQIMPFKLERFFGLYEFSVKYLLSSSDCEALNLAEMLEMASPESLALWQNLKLGYTESPGHPMLRSEISRGYTNIGPEDMLVAVPEEAIFVAMNVLLRSGDHVVALSPTYQSLYELARSSGCHLSLWELEKGPQGWQLDLNKLEDLITAETRLLVINFPNNPTGFQPSRQQFADILALAQKHGVYVFSDEMYRLLELDPALRLPSVSDVYERGVALSGLSKSFALPGLRVGWLTSPQGELIKDCLEFKDYTTICNSAPSEILAIIALQNTGRIVARNLEIITGNAAIAQQFFQRHSDLVEWIAPQAGSIAFPRWLGSGSSELFCQSVLDEQGVMIVAGSIFDYPGAHFRIGLGRKNFSEGLEHLDEYLSKHK